MAKTIRQSVQAIAKPKPQLDVATIIDVDVLAKDSNGVVLSVAPAVTANVHGTGGLQRIELSAGIDPLKLTIGDQIFVTQVQGRYIGVAPLPITNRTQGGGESYGNDGNDGMAQVQDLNAQIAGSALELAWEPVQGADYYEIWRSESADPSSDGASVVGRTGTTTWTGKTDGQFFDDGVYYSVVPKAESATLGIAGGFSDWVQPEFAGNYALGILSKNQTTGIGGSLVVTKSASLSRADFTSLDSPQSFFVDVCDPTGAHSTTALFAVNDILRAADASGNVLWVKVTATTDKDTYWRYTVTKQSPSAGTNYTIPSGTQILNFGTSGQGTFAVSADGTFGSGTLWTIFTHAGSPWSATTAQVYANDSGQVVAGAGSVLLDANGITLGLGPSADWISWGAGQASINAYQSGTTTFLYSSVVGDVTYYEATNGMSALSNLGAAASIYAHAQDSGGYADANLQGTATATLTLTGEGVNVGYGRFYTKTGVSISNAAQFNASSLLHLKSTAPTFRMEDSTASAKSLLLTVDANMAQFEEAGGAANDLLVLDLANARVGIGTASPTATFNVEGATVFNDSGADVDFRIEGDTEANLFFVDASTDRIGIGTGSPGALLEIYGDESPKISVNAANGGLNVWQVSASSSGNGGTVGVGTNDGAAMASLDRLGQFVFMGHDGSNMRQGPLLIAYTTEAWSSTARGSAFYFYTIPNGSTAQTLALKLEQDQQATFSGNLQIADAKNIILNTTTGTKIGTGTTQKLGFWNATPIAQPSAYTQTYSTADKTHANLTSATLTDSTGGTANTTLQSIGAAYSQTEVRNNFADLAASNNAIIVDLTDLKQLVNSLIDDLQALGLVG